ncbi:hypothetical protein ABK040_006829 [Willaertia magna]
MFKHRGVLVFLFVILFYFYSEGVSGKKESRINNNSTNNQKPFFLFMTDIHYDPFYDPTVPASDFCRAQKLKKNKALLESINGQQIEKEFELNRRGAYRHVLRSFDTEPSNSVAMYGRYGCDAPFTLVNSTFNQLKQLTLNNQPDFVIMAGDYNAHHLPNASYSINNIKFVSRLFKNTFPNTMVLPCIGNNDLYPDYYIPFIEDPENGRYTQNWFQSLYEEANWKEWLTEPYQRESFLKGGYYKYEMKKYNNPLHILVLNSMFYSARQWPKINNSKVPDDPSEQFKWLENELRIARDNGITCYIVTHIPATQNSYDNKLLWSPQYQTRFLSIVENYQRTVAAVFFGHLHKDEFINYDPNNNYFIKDYDQWTFDLYTSNYLKRELWSNSYTFSKIYQLNQVNGKSVLDLTRQFETNPHLMTTYFHNMDGLFVADRFKYICEINNPDEASYTSCLQRGSNSGAN